MLRLTNTPELVRAIAGHDAVVVLYGGAHCGVCMALKPKLHRVLCEQYPDIRAYYVDCGQYPAVAAQAGVFSLPVVRVYLAGQLCLEKARVFSVSQLMADLSRPYALMRNGLGQRPG